MTRILSILAAIFLWSFSFSQERAFHPNMYEDWNRLGSHSISNNGEFIFYESSRLKDKDSVRLVNSNSTSIKDFPHISKARFSGSSNYLLLERSLPFDTLRAIKLAKQNKDKWHGKKAELPKDSLSLFLMNEDSIIHFGEFEKYDLAIDSSDLLVALLPYPKKEKPKTDEDSKSKKKKKKKKPEGELKAKKKKGDKKDVFKLMYFSRENGHHRYIDSCLAFKMSKYGRGLTYVTLVQDSSVLNIIDLNIGESIPIHGTKGEYKQLTWNDNGTKLAFLHSTDTLKEKDYDLWNWSYSDKELRQLCDSNSFGLSYSLRDFTRLNFSENDDRLFIYYGRSAVNEPEKDSILKEEKAVVDVWSWTDQRLQTQQLNNLDQDKKATWLACYDFGDDMLRVLQDSTSDRVMIPSVDTVDFAVIRNNLPYQKRYSWDWPAYQDYYRLNLNDGSIDSLLIKHRSRTSLSPLGKFFLYYDLEKKQWWSIQLDNLNSKQVTGDQGVSWVNELHDTPSPASPYGVAGYTNGDSAVFIYDRYDIWLFHLYTGESMRLTHGREAQQRYRIQRLDRENRHLDLSNLTLSFFDEKKKSSGYYQLLEAKLKSLIEEDARIFSLTKARNADKLTFLKLDYQNPSDLFSADESLKNVKQISNFRSQMSNYDIGSVELVSWAHPKTKENLEGLLYRPADFDSTKKYPMLVYFYERNSNNLHRFWSPQPTASIIYPSMYASLGYVVFIPDIVYEEGQPGYDALDCINSGVDEVLKLGFVDDERIGLQGQSWGGYQTAFLITQTDKYAAAMAGAPVSNMTSAYGGIRWGSGYSRMFQYERTQSRLGKDLWSARDRYINNSPVFFANQVNTPLLIMHNDNDGAVPWYQGIEYFVALRRLEKPVWMLNYNNDAHNLRKLPNKEDLSVRMMQFFDHYLKDSPQPEWMSGIPALRKGIDDGLELQSE